MDFQTMSRKVKQKQYKSKADFSDDLELIWSNCSTYNTGDVRSFSFHGIPDRFRSPHALLGGVRPDTCFPFVFIILIKF